MPDALLAPIASRGNEKNHTSIVTTGTPLSTGIPRTNGFNGFLRALLGEPGFVATIACRSSSANLASASGCQDHTTSPSALAPLVRRRYPRPEPELKPQMICPTGR